MCRSSRRRAPLEAAQGTLRGQADKRTRGLFCAEYSAAQERQQIVLSIDSDILTDQSMALSILLCDTGFVVFARFRSEERRVGKERGSRWSVEPEKKEYHWRTT